MPVMDADPHQVENALEAARNEKNTRKWLPAFAIALVCIVAIDPCI
jgi:hypothetical protein